MNRFNHIWDLKFNDCADLAISLNCLYFCDIVVNYILSNNLSGRCYLKKSIGPANQHALLCGKRSLEQLADLAQGQDTK